MERVALPDASALCDYTLSLTTGMVEGLVVDVDRMRANMDLTGGLLYSSAVLLALVSTGMSREDAYTLVQGAAMETWSTGVSFLDTLRKQAATAGQALPEAEITDAFRPERYTQRLAPVFERLSRLS